MTESLSQVSLCLPSSGSFPSVMLQVASYTDVLIACHAIFAPFVEVERLGDEPQEHLCRTLYCRCMEALLTQGATINYIHFILDTFLQTILPTLYRQICRHIEIVCLPCNDLLIMHSCELILTMLLHRLVLLETLVGHQGISGLSISTGW